MTFNGPESIAKAVADLRCAFNGANTVFIDPGSPWQNAWAESLNGQLRDELLNGQFFETECSHQIRDPPARHSTLPVLGRKVVR